VLLPKLVGLSRRKGLFSGACSRSGLGPARRWNDLQIDLAVSRIDAATMRMELEYTNSNRFCGSWTSSRCQIGGSSPLRRHGQARFRPQGRAGIPHGLVRARWSILALTRYRARIVRSVSAYDTLYVQLACAGKRRRGGGGAATSRENSWLRSVDVNSCSC
jgi:hypothetical protein